MTARPLCALALFLACSSDPPAAPPLQPTDSTSPRGAAAPDAASVVFTGVVIAGESIDIAPRIAGRIARVHVRVGDLVTADQVVAEMDPTQAREELRAAEAALAAASAAYQQAQIDVEDATRKLALETRSVEAGISPTQNLDAARLESKRAAALAERARSTRTLEAARAQTVRDHVTETRLRSPIPGTVATRYRDAGNRIDAGLPILRIVGRGHTRLRFAVPPDLAHLAPIGARLTATFDTRSTPATAVVHHIAPTLDPASGLIFVEAELAPDVSNSDLRPGLAAWVRPD